MSTIVEQLISQPIVDRRRFMDSYQELPASKRSERGAPEPLRPRLAERMLLVFIPSAVSWGISATTQFSPPGGHRVPAGAALRNEADADVDA